MHKKDEAALEIAKTEFREAFNSGDVERLLAVYRDEFIDMSEGEPSYFGAEAQHALQRRLRKLFAQYEAKVAVIIINIVVHGDSAYALGWHKYTLKDKTSRGTILRMERYLEHWAKLHGSWKIELVVTSTEPPPQLLPEEETALAAVRG